MLETDAADTLDADGGADRGRDRARGLAGAADREPGQPDRHHARAGAAGRDRARLPATAASGSSPTRSTTASPTARPRHTALQYSDDAIVINSFSKYFSMTGWRVGWMVVPERLVRAGRAAGAEPLHLAAGGGAGGGASAPSTASRSSRPTSASTRQPRPAARELPKAGLDEHRAGRRRLLSLRRCRRFTDDSLAFARQMLRRDRRRRDAGRRLRRGARPPFRALLLCRHYRRHGRGGEPPRALAAAEALEFFRPNWMRHLPLPQAHFARGGRGSGRGAAACSEGGSTFHHAGWNWRRSKPPPLSLGRR